MGYRIALQSLTHQATIAPGRTLTLTGEWRNEGVAPAYVHYPLNYRLVGAKGNVIKQWTGRSDIRQWLPGEHQTLDSITLPKNTGRQLCTGINLYQCLPKASVEFGQ